ncbi:caspase family protein [Caulobacter sp. DWR1-3-2b1]|uniref:caspase family protein n=1 Tax=Caulobacter sp. DWR1-3-2b1 TaxID=2804670 RepID=UPI003CE9BCF3
MAKKTIRILGVHGLGDQRSSPWKDDWERCVRKTFASDADITLEFRFVTYDPIFETTKISFAETMKALWKLSRSGVSQIGRRERGLVSDVSDKVRWTAGYVVAWVEDKAFQAQTRQLMLDTVKDFAPDVILAHSLGSLVTYNAFSHEDARQADVAKLLANAHYVTFGSQIGNPFVIGNLSQGRVEPLAVRHWHHLYNEHDDVFTARIQLSGTPNFTQLQTAFDLPGVGDHDAEAYLGHNVTVGSLWRPLGNQAAGGKAFGAATDPWRKTPRLKTDKTRRRALLVGINDYPREADRLAGCVNDVFTISAALQECGFAPGDIRTCLNDRATAAGILERLRWLLDDAQPGDERVFYFSGHGARIPEYGDELEPDRQNETLVPWDFDWSPETSITDDQIFDLYSQLPYDSRLVLIFDCCHSGGVHRQGGPAARGISPPDDIRHRELKWDTVSQMWVERDFKRLNADFSTKTKSNADFFGQKGSTARLGRASMLRLTTANEYVQARKKTDDKIVGPYLPLIIEACGETQLSYEYRHGATSYGAFTFCLASLLRERKSISFEALVDATREKLIELQYDQTPQILGPTQIVKAKVPWNTGAVAGKTPSKPKPGGSTPRLSG